MSYGLYQHLYRIAYELKCTDSVLIWKSPLRTGTVPLSALRRIYSRGATLGVIEVADGSRIQIYAQKGFLTLVSRAGRSSTPSEWDLGQGSHSESGSMTLMGSMALTGSASAKAGRRPAAPRRDRHSCAAASAGRHW